MTGFCPAERKMRRLALAPIKSGEDHPRAAAMAVVFDHQERRNALHANETIAGLGASPVKRNAAVVGELEHAMRRLGLGADHPGMHSLRGRLDRLAADPH